jgi:pyruvate dehydrogenase E2 component (dihydrolipoamide acetyltransferase)
MISEVVMPQMGADMTEGTLLRWMKQEGDEVSRGEVIAEIETDKANVEIEAFESGVFRKTLANEGDLVQVGDVIAVIAGADEDISRYTNGTAPPPATQSKGQGSESEPRTAASKQPAQTVEAEQPDAPPAPAQAMEPKPETPAATAAAPQNGRVRASPLARRIAEERGIDLARVQGTGPGGRVIKRDVEGRGSPPPSLTAAAEATLPVTHPRAGAAAGPGADSVVQPSKMRQAIARRMSQSKREAPHYYITADVDMTEALAFRAQVNSALGDERKVSINDLIVRASVIALKAHPTFNATIEGEQVTQRAEQHVCIGIALEDGLIAPAIVGSGAMTLAEIAAAAKSLIDRAKNGRLRADEMSSGTFTVSNLGAYGVEMLVAIIQPPQTAILGVGAVAPQAVVREDAVVIRQMMKAALSADHRATDGAQGAEFLAEIKRLLEQPVLLVL